MNSERLTEILAFLETIDALKLVYRAAYLGDHSRHESSAEHTWHMAMFALLLAGETNLVLDTRHVLEMVLVHDLIEIDAGDTYVHLTAEREAAKLRERLAADRIFALLPPDLHARLRGWWDEFEEGQTPEARFARAIDRLHGFSQNITARGRVWQERSITEAMTRAVNHDAMELDPGLAAAYELLYERARQESWLETNEELSGDADRPESDTRL
ncbi:MAG TPA: HD domain-containing protein [Chloroflexota bacterium]